MATRTKSPSRNRSGDLPDSRPSTARRLSNDRTTDPKPYSADDGSASSSHPTLPPEAHADRTYAKPCIQDGDALLNPPTSTPRPASESQAAEQVRVTAERSRTAVDATLPAQSSFLEAVYMDLTKESDDSITEAVVREHLKDIESSFLPNLSPVPTGSSNGGAGGIDDTFLFDSPDKRAIQPLRDVGDTTSSLENLDSSPTPAAAARTISRAVSMATKPPAMLALGSSNGDDDDDQASDHDADHDADVPEGSHVSSSADPEGSLSRSQSLSERLDSAGTSGGALRSGRRPKFLRSRHTSHRSSASSFATYPESYEGSDATVAMGADYALQSGGAVPAVGMSSSRIASNPLPRSISLGSMASGFATDEYTQHSAHQLETLPEIESPERRNGDVNTPRQPRENITAPTDTVIARHVRNVQVPESLAKEYRFKGGLDTPYNPPDLLSYQGSAATKASRAGKNMTLKEQSSTIERLSKENFDLKLKVMFLSDRLDKLSEEGIKEMISENVDLKTNLAILQRDNKLLRRRVKELERQSKDDDDNRPSTARSGASSTGNTARLYDEEALEREEELIYLRERVEEYAVEIERLRSESLNKESDKRKLSELVKTLGERNGENLGRQDEVEVWKDLFEQETARREQADEDNRKLRDENFQLKQEMATGQAPMHHTTNIYNITKKHRDRKGSPNRPISGLAGEIEGSQANLSAGTTLFDELRRESEHLRHENAELRREVGAQTSMLTSRNREKERLQQEIEDLKINQRRGGAPAPSTVDSILERSASRAGGHTRSRSRGSAKARQTACEEDPEREELENQLAELRDKMNEVKLQNQELQRELDSCMDDFEAAINCKREAEESAASLQEDLENAMNDLIALQSERNEALRDQSEMEDEFEALRREAQEEIDTLEAEADQRNEEIRRIQADLVDRSENFKALQEEMRKMSESLVRLEDEQSLKLRRIHQLEEELDSSNKELEELEQKLMEANDKNQRLSVQHESSQGEVAFLREEQENDKIRIGDLEAIVANLEQSLREEKDRARELDGRLQEERRQRELIANKEKEEVQQYLNELNREASTAKDEARRLRKSLSSREVEATEWKERLLELENNLREALGDLNGTRSSLLKVSSAPFPVSLFDRYADFLQSIAKMQRELENTIRELDMSKVTIVEKDRIIKQRDALLESQALESRKMSELLEKERLGHRNTKSQFETFQRTHQHLTRTASTQDIRISELESTRSQDRRKIAILEQTARDQLHERNELLLILWQRLSALCGREWANGNMLIDRQVLPSLEVIANRLPSFSKNLLAAVKHIENLVGSFQFKIKSVERDLHREYQNLENNLEIRTKKLDVLETMIRNSVASASLSSHEHNSRFQRLEEAYRQLMVENATLRTAKDVRARAGGYDNTGTQEALTASASSFSPSPAVPRGPGARDRARGLPQPSQTRNSSRTTTMTRTNTISSSSAGMDVALPDDVGGNKSNNDNRWLLRLRDMEYKLKMEREGRNQDRQAARQRLSGLESENKDLRGRVKRSTTAGEG